MFCADEDSIINHPIALDKQPIIIYNSNLECDFLGSTLRAPLRIIFPIYPD